MKLERLGKDHLCAAVFGMLPNALVRRLTWRLMLGAQGALSAGSISRLLCVHALSRLSREMKPRAASWGVKLGGLEIKRCSRK